MALFEVVVEEETTGIQHRTVRIEAIDEEEAYYLVSEGQGDTIKIQDVDNYVTNDSSCELISVEEI